MFLKAYLPRLSDFVVPYIAFWAVVKFQGDRS